MTPDAELLRRYLAERSEAAFTELVQRHLGLVYGGALRRVGHDVQLAEDVAQKVFADLARKAGSLTGHATLSGWLYVSTHHASAEVVRAERRRKAREENARAMQTASLDPDSAPDWERLRPVLDDLILELKDEDREAVALRYFQQRTFAEIGATLRLTEEAARKRVDRALEKLRAALVRRGVTSTAAALSVALADTATASVPAGLAAKVAHAAFASGSAGATGTLPFLSAGYAAAGVALVVGGLAVVHQLRATRQLEAELARLPGETAPLAALRAENRALARAAAEAEELRRLQAELPALRAALAAALPPPASPPAVPATVTVQADGTIRWGDEPVRLTEFVARLQALKRTGNARLEIRGLAAFSQLAYAIDEARKAGLEQVVVESDVQPDPKLGLSWFVRR